MLLAFDGAPLVRLAEGPRRRRAGRTVQPLMERRTA
jgi:hypothetical protein